MSKNLLITGASRGIGWRYRLAGRRLAGRRVGVNYRYAQRRSRAVAAQIEAMGGKAVALPGDVANEEDVQRLFEAMDKLGRCTVWW